MTSLLAFLAFVASNVVVDNVALQEFLLTWRCSGSDDTIVLIEPESLMYSQDSIQCRFSGGRWAGRTVYDKTTVHDWGQRSRSRMILADGSHLCWDWTDSHRILASFHTVPGETYPRLFAISNRTLFNARYNSDTISMWIQVRIVPKPSDWDRRFTAKKPWSSIHVREDRHPHGEMIHMALRIPVDAFPSDQPNIGGDVVLEVRNLVNPKKDEPLFALLQNMCRDSEITVAIQQEEGLRAYA
jgi:hypothetical protein